MSSQVNQEAVAEVKMDGFGLKDIVWNGHHWTHILHVGDKLYTTPPDQASKSEINSLKQRVDELEAENTIMRDALNKIALGYVLDADIIESAGDCLQRLSTTKSLAEHDNATIERIATALENAEGELKYLPEYVSLVRGMKLTP